MSRCNPKGREINGVVLLDKSIGLSSNAALQQVKRLFFAKKAGHTGALDPLASGILPICLGQATKVAQFLLDDDKRYFVRGQLGQQTDTGDCEGRVIDTRSFVHLTEDAVRQASMNFVGDIEQVPPMYSALKKDGQPLYKLARQGITVERKPRSVCIHHIDFIGYDEGVVNLEVSCSKGTYIRTLIEDIGNQLGCGAHVIELRRTGFAQFDIAQAIAFSELEALATTDFSLLDSNLLPSEDMLPNIDSVYLDEQQSIDIGFGRKTHFLSPSSAAKSVKLFNQEKQFLGIGVLENDLIAPKRLFV